MKKPLTNKSILITAGPTWVPIDDVRVITNVFTGSTGYNIACYASNLGAKVTLLLGPGDLTPSLKFYKKIKIIHFKYFDELFKIIKKKLTSYKYDIIIHSAAISDYKPVKKTNGKIKSTSKNLLINCKRTPKIVDRIKQYAPSIYLVKFKLEVNTNLKKLTNIAYKSLRNSKADLIVANTFYPKTNRYKTLIIDASKNVVSVNKRGLIPEIIFNIINN